MSERAGRYMLQIGGYRAFVPAPLPPDPPIRYDDELVRLVSEAGEAVGRLDGAASLLPNPELFVAMYVRHEAVLSSQIEGTQSTLDDVLQFELDEDGYDAPRDIEEVVNYVRAMNYGLDRMATLPLSRRLICEIHGILLQGVRGGNRTPGEFRRDQNWIGASGAGLRAGEYVPLPVAEMHTALDNLEAFIHDQTGLPVLLLCGLVHAQFESIHPFMDGNGRIGRLLITFLLCQRRILHFPLLYMSYFLKAHRAEYYDRLNAVRNDGDWEGWLKFFLRGVHEVSMAAAGSAQAIVSLRESARQHIIEHVESTFGPRLLDYLFRQPIVTVRAIREQLSCSPRTASLLVTAFQELGYLRETTGNQRNRRFRFDPYLAIFEPPLQPESIESLRPPAKTNSGAESLP